MPDHYFSCFFVADKSLFQDIIHEVRSCLSSYTVDYNSLGDKYEDTDDVVEIWITTGRDQSTVLKNLVDNTFTAKTGIKVNVKLVLQDAILPAVVAGNGPDVVLSLSGWFAVNYAMRNAVEDLTQFEDFEEVTKPFTKSILEPLTYNDSKKIGIYGLPETQDFAVLFYRKDIMEELGLPIPQTWDELIAELPTIQGNSLTIGINFPDIRVVDNSVLNSMIYQNGGEIYDKEAKQPDSSSIRACTTTTVCRWCSTSRAGSAAARCRWASRTTICTTPSWFPLRKSAACGTSPCSRER